MDQTSRRLAALFAVGLLLLYPPLLGIFNRTGSLFGIPILPLYLFTTWGALLLTGWLLSRGDKS
jgi:hypothetical protein